MKDVVIKADNLGKQYMISHEASERYTALRDVIHQKARELFSRSQRVVKEEFWALKDINFEVKRGEAIGIIGRNGAGKSTLLKILSRITEPTKGRVEIHGRTSSLLEVGTGFHPELTGRENIFLNGAVLGMGRTEIKKKFDAIVDFSGVEKFLDTPVKRYSSGMYLRLAFAIAAHLEPEILMVDEVLAVGDAEFQKRCLGKMDEVSRKEGRTVLFVSHNMNFVSSICSQAIILDKGQIIESGDTNSVISIYISKIAGRSSEYVWDSDKQPGNEVVKLQSLRIIDSMLNSKANFKDSEKVGIEMKYQVREADHVLWLGHNIHNQFGINVFDTHSVTSKYYRIPHEKGNYTAIVWIPGNLLNAGNYYLSSAIFNHSERAVYFHERDLLVFNIYDSFGEQNAKGMSGGDFPGVVRPLLDWSVDKS